jgi:hypothetical protein
MRNPARETKNFLGWIIVGMAGLCAVVGLCVMVYNAIVRLFG